MPDMPLHSMLSPRSIVLYGASDKSNWSNAIFASIRSYGFEGNMYAVNKRGVPAHGLTGHTSCRELPEQVDAAYVYVPTEGVIEAFEDLAAAGIGFAVVLSSGFADAGEEGQALQARLVAVADRLGITFIGPNSLGFVDVRAGIGLTPMRPQRPFAEGHVALISQSGSVGYEIMEYALQQDVGLGFIAAMGNEAQVDLTDMIDAVLDMDGISAVAAYVETIRKPDRFIEVARKALALRKPIVMLKVGTGQISAAIAQAHTGSLVGNDRVLDAACQQNGVVRVTSLEQLVDTAALLVHTGVIEKEGIAAASLSGGSCSLFADAAEAEGLTIPAFAPETIAALREILPGFASTLNPLDVTGAGFNDLEIWGKCLRVISQDPSVGLTVAVGAMLPLGAVSPHLGAALADIGSRGLFLTPTPRPVDPKTRKALGIPIAFAGLSGILSGIASAIWWSKQVGKPAAVTRAASDKAAGARLKTERETLDHLAGFGVPVIPATIARTAAEAIAAAAAIRADSFALKIASPDIQHKTEVGGVHLNVEREAVGAAFDAIMASAGAARPDAKIDGVIVSPMRDKGVELIVGTVRDPDWGAAIVVGLGGIWVEILKDSALRLLPVDKAQARDMIESLSAVELLRGYRGSPPADLDRLAEVIVAIGDAALALGPDLATLEINPLRVSGGDIEALDGLAVYADEADAAH